MCSLSSFLCVLILSARTQVLAVPEAPQRIEWVGPSLCLAFGREYSLLDLESGQPTTLSKKKESRASSALLLLTCFRLRLLQVIICCC
jgi:hypothetical protein